MARFWRTIPPVFKRLGVRDYGKLREFARRSIEADNDARERARMGRPQQDRYVSAGKRGPRRGDRVTTQGNTSDW